MNKYGLFVAFAVILIAVTAYMPSSAGSYGSGEPSPSLAPLPTLNVEAEGHSENEVLPENEAPPLETDEMEEVIIEKEAEKETSAPVLPPNEINDVMIIMYHSFTDGTSRGNTDRNTDDFRNDLKRLYDGGFRLITLKSLIDNEIDIEAGYSPVILTFDDGWASAFSLEETNEGLVPVKNSGLGILEEFCREYPDFGKAGVFFINAYMDPFAGAGTAAHRLKYLADNGFEIGSHTYSHANLSKLGTQGIQREMALLDAYVKESLPDYKIRAMCYPYGAKPQNRELAIKGEYEGYSYQYDWAIREAPTKNSANPVSVNFDKLNVPRVRATNNAAMDLGWYLDYYENNPQFRYISDGDKDVISLPAADAHKVNHAALGDKILNIRE